MKRLVVFDLDDTLFLERDYVRSGFREVGDFVSRELGVRGFFEAAWWHFMVGDRDLIFDRVLEEKGVVPSPQLILELRTRYRNHTPSLRLCPDARRFLERPPEGVAIGVITDGRVPSQQAKMRALGIDRLVEEIVITGRWGPRYAKPHPHAFRLMERRFRMSGTACMYVGDNPAKDFQGPRSMEWAYVRLRRPGGLFAGVPSPGVPELRSCDELRRLITTLTADENELPAFRGFHAGPRAAARAGNGPGAPAGRTAEALWARVIARKAMAV